MAILLIVLGSVFLAVGILLEHPAVREKLGKPIEAAYWVKEEQRVKQSRQQVEKAREDVAALLTELDSASEKVVDLMSTWAEKARELREAPLTSVHSDPPILIETAKSRRTKPAAQNIKKPVKTADRYEKVFTLAKAGYSAEDIAQAVRLGKGEVQLLLDLNNKSEEQR